MSDRGSNASPISAAPSRLGMNRESFRFQSANNQSFYSKEGKSEAVESIYNQKIVISQFKKIKENYKEKIQEKFPKKILFIFHIVNLIIQLLTIILMSLLLRFNEPQGTFIVTGIYALYSILSFPIYLCISIIFIQRSISFIIDFILQVSLVTLIIYQIFVLNIIVENIHYFNWIIGIRLFISLNYIMGNYWIFSSFYFLRNPFRSHSISTCKQAITVCFFSISLAFVVYITILNSFPGYLQNICVSDSGEATITLNPIYCSSDSQCPDNLFCRKYSKDQDIENYSFDDPLQSFLNVLLLLFPYTSWTSVVQGIGESKGYFQPVFIFIFSELIFQLLIPSLWLGMCYWSISQRTKFPGLSLSTATRERIQQLKKDSKIIKTIDRTLDFIQKLYDCLSFQFVEWLILFIFLILEIIFLSIDSIREWKYIVDLTYIVFSLIQILFLPIALGSKYRVWVITDYISIFSSILWTAVNYKRLPQLLNFRFCIKSLILLTRIVKERFEKQFSRAISYVILTYLIFLPMFFLVISSIGYDLFANISSITNWKNYLHGFDRHTNSFLSTFFICMGGEWIISIKYIYKASNIDNSMKVLIIIYFILIVIIFHVFIGPHFQGTIVTSFSKIHSYKDLRYEQSALLQTFIKFKNFFKNKKLIRKSKLTNSSLTSVFPESETKKQETPITEEIVNESESDEEQKENQIEENLIKVKSPKPSKCLSSFRYFKRFFRGLVSSQFYQCIYSIVIISFIISLFFEISMQSEFSNRKFFLQDLIFDSISFTIFLVDIIIRLLQFYSLKKDPIIVIDIFVEFILLISCISFVAKPLIENSLMFQILKIIRSIRVIKPLRCAVEIKAIKRYFRALWKSTISLFVYFLLLISLLLVFALIGNASFRESRIVCNDLNIGSASSCYGIFKNKINIYTPRYTPKSLFASISQSLITTFELTNLFHFNQIFQEVLSNSFEFWETLYFVGFSLIICFFISFIPLALIYFHIQEDRFGKAWAPEKREWGDLKEWALLQKPVNYFHENYYEWKNNFIQKFFFLITSSKTAKGIISFLLTLSALAMAIQYSNEPYGLYIGTKVVAVLVILFSIIENIFHIIAVGLEKHTKDELRKLSYFFQLASLLSPLSYFFDDSWDTCFMLLIFFSVLLIVVHITDFLRKFKSFSKSIDMLCAVSTSIFYLLLILLWLVISFSIIGMNSFGQIKFQSNINWQTNFRSVQNSMLLIFQLLILGNWRGIAHDLSLENMFCSSTSIMNDCGSKVVTYLFIFIVFIVVPTIWMNLFICVILDHYALYFSPINHLRINRSIIENFIYAWSNIDPEAKGYAPLYLLEDLNKILISKCNSHSIAFHSLDRKEMKKFNLIVCEIRINQRGNKEFKKFSNTMFDHHLPFTVEWFYLCIKHLLHLAIDRLTIKFSEKNFFEESNDKPILDIEEEELNMSFWYCLYLIMYHHIPNNAMVSNEFKIREKIMQIVEKEYYATKIQKWWRKSIQKKKRAAKHHRIKREMKRGASISSLNSQKDTHKLRGSYSIHEFQDQLLETIAAEEINNITTTLHNSHSQQSYKMSENSSETSEIFSEEPTLVTEADTFMSIKNISVNESPYRDLHSTDYLSSPFSSPSKSPNTISDRDILELPNNVPRKSSFKKKNEEKTKRSKFFLFRLFSRKKKNSNQQKPISVSWGESQANQIFKVESFRVSGRDLTKHSRSLSLGSSTQIPIIDIQDEIIENDIRSSTPNLLTSIAHPGTPTRKHRSNNKILQENQTQNQYIIQSTDVTGVPMLTITDANSRTETPWEVLSGIESWDMNNSISYPSKGSSRKERHKMKSQKERTTPEQTTQEYNDNNIHSKKDTIPEIEITSEDNLVNIKIDKTPEEPVIEHNNTTHTLKENINQNSILIDENSELNQTISQSSKKINISKKIQNKSNSIINDENIPIEKSSRQNSKTNPKVNSNVDTKLNSKNHSTSISDQNIVNNIKPKMLLNEIKQQYNPDTSNLKQSDIKNKEFESTIFKNNSIYQDSPLNNINENENRMSISNISDNKINSHPVDQLLFIKKKNGNSAHKSQNLVKKIKNENNTQLNQMKSLNMSKNEEQFKDKDSIIGDNYKSSTKSKNNIQTSQSFSLSANNSTPPVNNSSSTSSSDPSIINFIPTDIRAINTASSITSPIQSITGSISSTTNPTSIITPVTSSISTTPSINQQTTTNPINIESPSMNMYHPSINIPPLSINMPHLSINMPPSMNLPHYANYPSYSFSIPPSMNMNYPSNPSTPNIHSNNSSSLSTPLFKENIQNNNQIEYSTIETSTDIPIKETKEKVPKLLIKKVIRKVKGKKTARKKKNKKKLIKKKGKKTARKVKRK